MQSVGGSLWQQERDASMAKQKIANRGHHRILSNLASHDDEGALRVVVETPRGSRNKYDYNPDCDCMELGAVLPEGMSFPYDFGFIPSTLGEDGDPLDVLVLLDAPVVTGCVVMARPIGVIEARQKDKRGGWIRNDRLLAVAVHAHTHGKATDLQGLRPHLLAEIKAFFVDYNEQRNRKFEILCDRGPKAALKLIEAARKACKAHSKKSGGAKR
jgi:inorganic pyrophosphatase